MTIRVRDPSAANANDENPSVSRVDLIAGNIDPALIEAAGDVNPSTTVVRRFAPEDRAMEELFATGAAFASQPLSKGPRVGIVTNAGGPGILATDACSSLGLELPELAEDTRARLRAVLPQEAAVRNPVDMIASAGPEQYAECLRAVLDDESIDSVLVIFVTPIYIDSLAVARAIHRASAGAQKPILCCFLP